MIERILVPLDHSELSERALGVAFGVARRYGSAIRLVSVWPVEVSPMVGAVGEMLFAPIEPRDAVESYLAHVADDVRARGVSSVETAILTPPVARAIRDDARRTGANLIVMSTHGRTGWSRMWIGSVADAVVREAALPVLLVRGTEAARDAPMGMERILVLLDGSPEAETILDPLREFCAATAARIRLLRIVRPAVTTVLDVARGVPIDDVDDPATVAARREAESYLESIASRLTAVLPKAFVTTEVRMHSSPGRAVVEAAYGEDVVAMVSSTHGARRLMLGSVTDKVLRGTSASLLVTHVPRTNKPSGAQQTRRAPRRNVSRRAPAPRT